MTSLSNFRCGTLRRGLTSFVSSAGACERIWSEYGFIHSKRRNKVTPSRLYTELVALDSRANDVVFVFTNSRMMTKFYGPEKFADWVDEMKEEDGEM